VRLVGELDALDPVDGERANAFEVDRREDEDALGRADRPEARMRVRAPNEREVRHPRQLDVVEVARLAPQDALVLAPADRLPDEWRGGYIRCHRTS